MHWGGYFQEGCNGNPYENGAELRMQSTCCKAAMRRNRCSFVKVALLSESRDAFGSEVNTQFGVTILSIHSARFHGGLPPRQDQEALTLHTQRCHHGNHTGKQPVDFSHRTFFFFFSFSVQIDGERGRKSSTCTPDG